MKSVLLFSFMTILANFMWCGKNDKSAPPGPPSGTYSIIERQTWLYDSNNQIIGETKQSFNKGEKMFELNPENGDYKEFENGNLTKSGTYLQKYGFLYIILNNDTTRNEIIGLGESSLWLTTFEKYTNGKKQITTKAEK